MSELAVADFLNSASTNPGLLSRISSAGEGRSPAEAGEAISALGAEAGYEFSGPEALAVRETILAKVAGRTTGEDSVLEGVRGGSGSGDPYLDAQIDAATTGLGMVGPTGTGVIIGLGTGAAQGNLGGAAVDAANDMNDTKNAVQEFFSSVFSGW